MCTWFTCIVYLYVHECARVYVYACLWVSEWASVWMYALKMKWTLSHCSCTTAAAATTLKKKSLICHKTLGDVWTSDTRVCCDEKQSCQSQRIQFYSPTSSFFQMFWQFMLWYLRLIIIYNFLHWNKLFNAFNSACFWIFLFLRGEWWKWDAFKKKAEDSKLLK